MRVTNSNSSIEYFDYVHVLDEPNAVYVDGVLLEKKIKVVQKYIEESELSFYNRSDLVPISINYICVLLTYENNGKLYRELYQEIGQLWLQKELKEVYLWSDSNDSELKEKAHESIEKRLKEL